MGDQIAKQQEITRSLMQSVQDHKPVLDRLNKTGGALLRLVVEDDAYRVQDIIETDNQRYTALQDTADQVNNAEPVSAHPEKIKEQMDDNNAIIDDMAKKESAYDLVCELGEAAGAGAGHAGVLPVHRQG